MQSWQGRQPDVSAMPVRRQHRETRRNEHTMRGTFVAAVAPPSDGYMQALAASVDGVFTTSINPIVCPTPPVCVPYRNGQIVFRDRHHIMTTFAIAERNKIWDLFVKSGATRALR